MGRTPVLALAALSAFLLVLPLVAHKPGMPATLKADEPAYFLAALSLAEDFDLLVTEEDRRRLFAAYPYLRADNVIVMSDDGWRTLYYGKPYLYSMAAAPLAKLFGANGLVLLNMAMLLGMVWMGFSHLRRYNGEGVAALFSGGFFLLSAGFPYVFWLHPEVFNMFAAALCLYFGMEAGLQGSGGGRWQRFLASPWALCLSAAGLASGVYNKPMLAALGVPVCLRLLRLRRWRDLAVWLAAAALAIFAYSGVSWLLTGKPTAYLVGLRAGLSMSNPDKPMVAPIPLPDPPAESASGADGGGEVEKDQAPTAGWWWIFRIPETRWSEVSEDLGYFFIGRHTGLLPYMPFAFLSLLCFALHRRRDVDAWAILGSTAVVALFIQLFIAFNWHGGSGFVGNRYFVMAYPAFIFAVGAIRPRWLLVPFYGAAALWLGPLLLTPFSVPMVEGTLQGHVRNPQFSALPVELSIDDRIPGYHGAVHADRWLWGRKDHIRPVKEELWFQGATAAEAWMISVEPVERAVFELRSPVVGNGAEVRFSDAATQVELGPEPLRVELSPEAPTLIRQERRSDDYQRFQDIYVYRLTVTTQRGELPSWTGAPGPRFYLGAAVRHLGPKASLEPAAGASPRVEGGPVSK